MTDDTGALMSALDSRAGCGCSTEPNGVRLICRQPWRGEFAYLHVIHPGLKCAELTELAQIFGAELPPLLRDFYTKMNGLQLFEALLNVNGLVEDFSRIPAKFQPFCPMIRASTFPGLHPSWHRLGYFPIGTWVGYSRKAIIACNKHDDIVVFDEETGRQLRQYPNIVTALRMLAAEMDLLWQSDGKLGVPEQSLDAAFVVHGSA